MNTTDRSCENTTSNKSIEKCCYELNRHRYKLLSSIALGLHLSRFNAPLIVDEMWFQFSILQIWHLINKTENK